MHVADFGRGAASSTQHARVSTSTGGRPHAACHVSCACCMCTSTGGLPHAACCMMCAFTGGLLHACVSERCVSTDCAHYVYCIPCVVHVCSYTVCMPPPRAPHARRRRRWGALGGNMLWERRWGDGGDFGETLGETLGDFGGYFWGRLWGGLWARLWVGLSG